MKKNIVGRQSNFELLRIMAMFLVLVIHANSGIIGMPTAQDVSANVGYAYIRHFVASIAIMCVNLFVLISGWFGVILRIKSLANFLFQYYYYIFGSMFLLYALGEYSFSWNDIGNSVFLQSGGWFVEAYLILVVLSPMLNKFVEVSSEKELRWFLMSFFFVQTFIGWPYFNSNFHGGYSSLSFCGLYLLARYLRIYLNQKYDKMCLVSLLAVILIVLSLYGMWGAYGFMMYSYLNPLVIIASVLLLLIFSRLNFYSKTINWIGISCFSVYLIHANRFLKPSFNDYVQLIYNTNDGAACFVFELFFLLAIFCVCIVVDKLRIVCWKWVICKTKLQ